MSDLAWRAEIRDRVRALRAKRELEAEIALAVAREKTREQSPSRQLRLPIESAMHARSELRARERSEADAALRRTDRAKPLVTPRAGAPAGHTRTVAGSAVSHALPDRAMGAAVALAAATRPVSAVRTRGETTVSPVSQAVTPAKAATSPRAVVELVAQLETPDIGSKPDQLIEFDPAIFNDSAPLRLRALAAVIDLVALAVALVPFLALAELSDANYHDRLTRLMIGVMIVSVVVGYFAISIGVSSKTVGMHFAGIRVVDYLSRLQPNFVQTTLRAFGYALAAAPLMAGIGWILIDGEHRGLHDHLSSTAVVQDQ